MRNPDTCDHHMTMEYGCWYCAYCSYGLAEMLAAKQDAQKNKAIDEFQAAKLQEAMDERVEPPTPKRWKHLRRVK